MMNPRPIVAPIAFAALLSGCAIQELKRDNEAASVRIAQKQDVLAAEEDNYRRLVAERDRVQRDLARSEFTASQLRAQLEQMSRLNDATPGNTPQQKASRARRAQQLSESRTQAQAVERDTSLSREQKQKQLDALKAKTRTMLDLLLQG